MNMSIEAYDAARSVIEKEGFTPTIQTKVSMFISAAKNTNAMFLGAVELQPMWGNATQLLHTQYFHEMEAVVLLSKITHWSSDTSLYSEGFAIASPLWYDWQMVPLFAGVGGHRAAGFYRGLALGHALLSQLRFAPLMPANMDETDPYVIALRHIEQDNARMIQTQITLLRMMCSEVEAGSGEELIEEKHEVVKNVFRRFLQWLCA